MARLALIALATLLLLAQAQAQTQVHAEPARDSTLCTSQLELLLSGGKLTDREAETFRQQCACLAEREASGEARTCTQPTE